MQVIQVAAEPLTRFPPAEVEDLQPVARTFKQVKADSYEMDQLRLIFEKILLPLYGPQEEALNKIALGLDRLCYLFYEAVNPVGVIAFKTLLSDEFGDFGIKKSIEIKSLFVVDPEVNSGKGIGSALLDKVTEEAQRINIIYDSLHVTVSETKEDSLIFFKKKGFRIIHHWKGKYIPGITEYLLARMVDTRIVQREKLRLETATIEKSNIASDEYALQKNNTLCYRLKGVAACAHWNDIHALIPLPGGNSFISGSKDNSIRKWNYEGEVVREVLDVDPVNLDQKERNWITAISVLNDDYWLSADRSGRIRLWTTEGDFVRNLLVRRPGSDHFSHEKNKHRVNCIAAGLDKNNPSFFVGYPTMFSEFSFIENRTVSVTKVHNNDWVYAIHPLSETSNIVVIAGKVDVWAKKRDVWEWSTTLFKEKQMPRGRSRAHIAALTPLESSPNHFGLGIFGGYVDVLDITTSKVIREWREHRDTVWSIVNVNQNVFASSGGKNGVIKLWDTRVAKSVCTIGPHGGEVCAMMKVRDNLIVAGASPSDVKMSNEGTQLLFYDIRAKI